MTTRNKDREYLGDGVYVDHDGWQLRLTAEDGARVTNEVFIEPEVLQALLEYLCELGEQNTQLAVVARRIRRS